MKKLVIGVTGHRKLFYVTELTTLLDIELKKISKKYLIKAIISPLADGADRLVVEILMERFNANLIVSLPFEKDEYKKDFSQNSQWEFNNYLKQAFKVDEVGSLEKNSRDECYLNVGKYIVEKCDILIALWDGKEANGMGGTGDIVKYAKEQEKDILHINTETLMVIN